MKYLVLKSEDRNKLEEKVTWKMEDGWFLTGGVATYIVRNVGRDDTVYFLQAIYK